MSAVSARVPILSKMEPIGVETLNTIARTVVRIACSSQRKPIRKQSNNACCELVSSVAACVELHGSLPLRGKRLRGGEDEQTQQWPDVKETLLPATPNDVLELDELWSFVQKKEQTRWVWTARCRRTRQIVACVRGDRSPSDLSSPLGGDPRGIQ